MNPSLNLCLILVAGTFVIYAEEPCYDEVKLEERYKDYLKLCRDEYPAGTEKRVTKFALCLLKKDHMIDDKFVLNVPALKEELEDIMTKAEDKVKAEALVDRCWEEAHTEGKLRFMLFFACFNPKVSKICPAFNDWKMKQIGEI